MSKNELRKLFEDRILIITSLLAVSLLVGQVPLSIAFVLWVTLFPFSKTGYGSERTAKFLLSLPIIYGFISAVVSGFLMKDYGDLAELRKYLPFILIPFGVWFTRGVYMSAFNLRIIFKSFVLASAATLVISFAYGLLRWIIYKNSIFLTYNHLADLFGVQPIYLSIFYLLAILLAFDLILEKEKSRRMYIVVSGILFIGIIFLGSRSSLIIASIILVYRVYGIMSNKKLFLFGILSTVILGGLLIYSIPTLRSRTINFHKNVASYSGIDFRVKLWNNALTVSESSPVWGYGYTNSQEALQREYEKNNFRRALIARMNAHNQYIQTMLDTGILGFIPFMLMLFLPLSIKRGSFTANAFWISISIAILTESFFRRQFGVIFYVLFYSLFVLRDFGSIHNDRSIDQART